MKRHRWLVVALPVVTAAVMVSGCGQADGPDEPSGPPTGAQTPPGPPAPTTTWQPQPPEQAVEAGWVRREYAAALDAAVASVASVSSDGGALSWPGRAQVSTERFSGVCVVRLERVGSGAFSPDVDALRQSLATAVAGHGFDDLAIENDPGGALMFVAHDSRDVLFEFRSKGETTISVRVATVDSECGG